MTLLLYTGQGGNSLGNASDFFFDCAVISSPASTPPSSEAPSSPSSSKAPSSTESIASQGQRPHRPLAAAIGGALGGLTAIVTVALAVLCYKKRNLQRRKQPAEYTLGHLDPSLAKNPPILSSASRIWSPTTPQPPDIDIHTETNDISPLSTRPTSTMPSEMPVIATVKNVNEAGVARADANPVVGISTSTSSTDTGVRLTEEQSELVQGLIKHKVPLPTVVGAIEGILRGDGYSGDNGSSSSRLIQSNALVEADNPPVYRSV